MGDTPTQPLLAATAAEKSTSRAARDDACATWTIAISCSLSYSLSYFWRYPVFVLPSSILGQHVVGCLDLQTCLSLAMVIGFGLAKLPATTITASPFFFRHRLRVLLLMQFFSMLVHGLGILADAAVANTLAVLFSSFLSSFLFAMQLTYLEGRRATEAMLATITMCLVYAGNASRGLGSLALRSGCPPRWMPLAVGAIAWVPSAALLLLTDRCPRPSAADVAERCERGTMSAAARWGFLCRWLGGLGPLIAAYALLVGVRTLRDLFSAELFAEALGVQSAPTYVFFVADVPGAVLSGAALLSLGALKDSRAALFRMLHVMLGAIALALGATALFQAGWLGGLGWQLCLGAGLFVAYSLLGAPVCERLLAATRTSGTISFLVLLEDCCGYAVSVALLLYQNLGADCSSPSITAAASAATSASAAAAAAASAHSELDAFLRVLWACGIANLVLLLIAMAYFRATVSSAAALRGAAASGAAGKGADADADGGGVYDLAIIGAGLIGSAAARHAVGGAVAGTRVALVGPCERPRDQWGNRSVFGAHHDEGRITRCTDPDPTWAELARRSIDRYAAIAEASGIDFFREVGHLAVAPADSPTLEARIANAATMGVPCERLDAAALRARFPYLAFPEGAAAVWEPSRSGYISARGLVAAQMASAAKGATSRAEAERAAWVPAHSPDASGEGMPAARRPCSSFCHYDDEAIAVEELLPGTASAKRPQAGEAGQAATASATAASAVSETAAAAAMYRVVMSSGREIWSSRVLVSCGAFTNGPGKLLPAELDLTNTTTQTVQFSLAVEDARRLHGMPSVICKFPHFWAYVLPPITYPDGRCVLKLGGARIPTSTSTAGSSAAASATAAHASPAGTRPLSTPAELIAWYRSGGDAAAAEEMAAMLHGLVPGLCPLDVRSDACANCRTATGLPYIGRLAAAPLASHSAAIASPDANASPAGLYVATGGNGLAAKSSDEIGRLAALAALGRLHDGRHEQLWGAAEAERFVPRCR